MSRRKARELALRALYANEMSGNAVDGIIEDMIDSTDEEGSDREFAASLLRFATEKKEDCAELIVQKSHNWDFERIAVIDKLILRLAICEFLYFEDIPPKVSIDEAIEMAKEYSTEKSGPFINGILDSVLIDLEERALLKKAGRGLE